MRLPTIDKQKIFSTDNGGIALTWELEQWFEDVVDVLNYLIKKWELDDQETREKLTELILAVNRAQHSETNHAKSKSE